MKKNIFLFIGLMTITLLTSCSSNIGIIENGYTNYGNLKSEQFKRPEIGEEIAVITTDKGVIKVRLLEENAPTYVENFKNWVREGAYDGTKFSRGRIDAFIALQDNKFHEKYKLQDTSKIENLKGYLPVSGELSAIRAYGENSSLFSINCGGKVNQIDIDRMENLSETFGYTREVIKAYKSLGGVTEYEYQFTIFGQVFYGMDIVREINQMETELIDGHNMYVDDIIIRKIELVLYEGDI